MLVLARKLVVQLARRHQTQMAFIWATSSLGRMASLVAFHCCFVIMSTIVHFAHCGK